jgi:hypothetical protein
MRKFCTNSPTVGGRSFGRVRLLGVFYMLKTEGKLGENGKMMKNWRVETKVVRRE